MTHNGRAPASGGVAEWRSGQKIFGHFATSPLGHSHARGFTLIELFTAMALSMIVVLAIGQIDVSRVRLSQEIRRRAPAEAAFALAYMARSLQQADRIVLLSLTSVQFRQFTGDPTAAGALDIPANYTWGQYRLVGLDIVSYSASCAVNEAFTALNSLDIQYADEAPAPPGGDPPVQDNNVLQIIVDGRYTTELTIRAGAYTNLMTGLAPPGVSDPPAPC